LDDFYILNTGSDTSLAPIFPAILQPAVTPGEDCRITSDPKIELPQIRGST
jgi:hypothetical protein